MINGVVSLSRYFLILFILFFETTAAAADLVSRARLNDIPFEKLNYENSVIKILDLVRKGNLDAAISESRDLLNLKPDFKLARLIYGDLLLAKSRGISDFGNYYSASFEDISSLLEEARIRWKHHHKSINKDLVPFSLVQLNEDQKFVVVIDLQSSRLYLYENVNGTPELHSDYYVSIGKNGIGKLIEGDQKTPIGVYFVTEYIDSKELPDLYGDGAFPIDYPNAWDVRHNRTGYGIWLHGTPSNTYTRPPRDSDGCVIMSNDDFRKITQFIDVKVTPVILAKEIKWMSKQQWQTRAKQYNNFLEQWRVDWESRDADRYLSHYSKQYHGLGNDYDSWVQYKKQVNPSKKFIEVKLQNTSMFLYPGDENLLVVTFEQDYQSDNFQRRFIKRQYWKMEPDGKWRIIYEGNVS